VECPMFCRQLRKVLTDMELEDAIQQLHLLERSAAEDRRGN